MGKIDKLEDRGIGLNKEKNTPVWTKTLLVCSAKNCKYLNEDWSLTIVSTYLQLKHGKVEN